MIIAILDSDIKDTIKSSKKACLFLKLPRPLLNINERIINVIKVNNKIVELETYKKIIKDPIYKTY